MVMKLIAVLVLLSNTVSCLSVHAASLEDPPPLASTAVLPAPDNQEVNPDLNVTDSSSNLDLNYVKSYLTDSAKIVTMPFHWDKKDWLKLGMVVGATGSLMLLDQKIKTFSQNNKSQVASKFAVLGNDLGNGAYTLPAVGSFYLYGYLADDNKARKTSLLALESFALSGLLTSGLKVLAERHRPSTGDLPTAWDGPHISMKNLSFSSGHTASAFSIATVFAEQYKDQAWVPPVAYSLATLTGLSRIYSNAHWSSDVFFGGAIGYFMSKAILKLHKDDEKAATHLMILPAVSKEMTGVRVKYDF